MRRVTAVLYEVVVNADSLLYRHDSGSELQNSGLRDEWQRGEKQASMSSFFQVDWLSSNGLIMKGALSMCFCPSNAMQKSGCRRRELLCSWARRSGGRKFQGFLHAVTNVGR